MQRASQMPHYNHFVAFCSVRVAVIHRIKFLRYYLKASYRPKRDKSRTSVKNGSDNMMFFPLYGTTSTSCQGGDEEAWFREAGLSEPMAVLKDSSYGSILPARSETRKPAARGLQLFLLKRLFCGFTGKRFAARFGGFTHSLSI
jgi:hypothetical protein